VRQQSTDLANVNFSGREDDVDLNIPDGLETTEVPRVLITGFVRSHSNLKESMTNDVVAFDLLDIVDDLSEFFGG
jgi:hypothetical protein